MAALTLLILSLFLLLEEPTAVQRYNLRRYRQAYTHAASARERDSIRKEVLEAVPDMRVTAEQGEQQVRLWDNCCSDWVVEEVPGSTQRIHTQHLPPLEMHEVGNVRFLTSDDLPGYGNRDVYTTTLHYYPQLGTYKWLSPINVGSGVNTAADEYGVAAKQDTLFFRRRVGDTARGFQATPRVKLRSIVVSHSCPTTHFVYVDAFDCRSEMVGSFALSDAETMSLPENAETLHLRCCGSGSKRVFSRCAVNSAVLALEDTDVRTHQCAGGTMSALTGAGDVFGFSLYEDSSSAVSAFSEVAELVLFNTDVHAKLHIETLPNMLEPQIAAFANELSKRGIAVVLSVATKNKVTVSIR